MLSGKMVLRDAYDGGETEQPNKRQSEKGAMKSNKEITIIYFQVVFLFLIHLCISFSHIK